MRGVLFCVTHSDILCICTPIGDSNLIFLSILKIIFPLWLYIVFLSPSIGVQIHSVSECVGQLRGVSFRLKGKCAVFYSV